MVIRMPFESISPAAMDRGRSTSDAPSFSMISVAVW
jgi:hypothetical protein